MNQPSAGYSETGFVIEAGYYISPNLRFSAGYAFGDANDRDFSGSRSASGPYLGITIKLNELFDGFGIQKVAPPQQQEAPSVEPDPIASKPTDLQKLQARLSRRLALQSTQKQRQNGAAATSDSAV